MFDRVNDSFFFLVLEIGDYTNLSEHFFKPMAYCLNC